MKTMCSNNQKYKNIFNFTVVFNVLSFLFYLFLERNHDCRGADNCEICYLLSGIEIIVAILAVLSLSTYISMRVSLWLENFRKERFKFVLEEENFSIKEESSNLFDVHKTLIELKEKLLFDMEVIY